MVPPIVICRALTGQNWKRFPFGGIRRAAAGDRKAMRLAGLAWLALVLALAGCGGATPQTESSAIPRSAANKLAAQSESIAAAWEAGDTCGAAQKADDLMHAVDGALASGEIPAAYQDELEAA